MKEFKLSKERGAEIKSKLPVKIGEVYEQVIRLTPPFVALPGGPKERLSRAVVCLQDAAGMGQEVVYALSEALAHIAWYRDEHPAAPKQLEAVFFGKYYADDATLRLYAAGEDVAEFVIDFIGMDRRDLTNSKTKKKESKASKLGAYLLRKKPKERITKLLQKLINNGDWKKAMDYRNTWVHAQPPTIEGTGIVYKRKLRWEKQGCKYKLTFGGGDKPDYNLDELLEVFIRATHGFGELLADLSEMLFARLGEIKKRFESGKK